MSITPPDHDSFKGDKTKPVKISPRLVDAAREWLAEDPVMDIEEIETLPLHYGDES